MARRRGGLRSDVRGTGWAMLAAAAAFGCAGAADADVIAIGDDGSIVTSAAPALYLSADLHPAPIARGGEAAPASAGFATPAQASPSARPGIAAAIDAASTRLAIDPALAHAVAWRESRYDAAARSPKGATGVMQLMPATARSLGVDPADPVANVEGGVTYLAMMLRRYGGDVVKALAAYNAGPGAVDRYRGVPPFRETAAYVAAILDRLADSALAGR